MAVWPGYLENPAGGRQQQSSHLLPAPERSAALVPSSFGDNRYQDKLEKKSPQCAFDLALVINPVVPQSQMQDQSFALLEQKWLGP